MDLFVRFQKVIAKTLITHVAGIFASVTWRPFKNWLINCFISSYNVDMTEAKALSIDQYANFNAFFTRELKADARPIAAADSAIVSPADGAISQLGDIYQGRILQAKGIDYSVARLLADQNLADQLEGGCFATVYLSPKDYHRVHMPCDGELLKIDYVPGKLFSVNQRTAENVDGLFAKNERIVATFSHRGMRFALVMVGAMIVGGMETVFTGPIARGKQLRSLQGLLHGLKKGDEFGRFYLGSTAIMLFPKAMNVEFLAEFAAGAGVRMGQQLAQKLPASMAYE